MSADPPSPLTKAFWIADAKAAPEVKSFVAPADPLTPIVNAAELATPSNVKAGWYCRRTNPTEVEVFN